MAFVLETVRTVVVLVIYVLQIAMLVRAVLSWVPMRENKFTDILYAITEPVVMPVRMFFDKMGWFRNLPIDVSFFVAYLLLSILGMLL